MSFLCRSKRLLCVHSAHCAPSPFPSLSITARLLLLSTQHSTAETRIRSRQVDGHRTVTNRRSCQRTFWLFPSAARLGVAMRIRLMLVAPPATPHDASTAPHRQHKRTAVESHGTTIAALLVAVVAVGCDCGPIAAVVADSSSSSSSSTGVTSPSNSTLLVNDGAESLTSRLPVSVPAAIGIVCACIVTLCLCLALCARSQMRVTRTAKSRGKGTTGGGSSAIQAKIDAARRGWRKSDGGDPAIAGGVVFSGGARSSQNQWEVQLHAMSVLAGGSMGGLGACRYPHFGSEDFVDEPWATAANIESLRVSGCILDVVLTTRESMALSALSGLIPLGILIALPFHEMLLKELQLSDWYGPILAVEFDRCVTIASAALAVHVGAVLLARRVYKYDRGPSIAAEKEAARLKKLQAEAQRMAAVLPSAHATPTGAAAAPSPFTMHTFMRSPTHPPSATFAATKGAGGAETSAGPAADPAAVPGRDPSVWPLAIFCACTLLSYALLGFQAYNSFDESLGRRYEVTATPRLVWPESAGRGPFITFILCLIVGCVAIVPIAFSLKLLALFLPRRVHPHLLRKAE